MERTIKINGQARLSAAPDSTRITVNLNHLSEEYSMAVSYASDAVNEMTDIVVRAGFPASDLKTLSWNVTAEYEYQTNEKNEQVSILKGYRYRHSFIMELSIDHEAVGRILKEVIRSSLTPEISLKYFVSEMESYKDKLLKQAVEVSRSKAEVIAQAGGVQLGEIISMEYSFRQLELPRGAEHQMAVPRALSAGTFRLPDITPADVELSETVTVVWRLF